ncbi:MAG: hypothetical protein IPK19_06140 [Chloroflexi bacterium]|nr:hypothetical protein [Chloroflexota bacterium]
MASEVERTNAAASRTVEERLQPWFDQAEYLIVLVIAFMAWAAGWVDLLGFQSDTNTIVFGRYSLPYAAILLVYTLGFGVWIWMIVSLRALERLKQFVALLQRQPWLFGLIWIGFGVVIWTMLGGSLLRWNFAQYWAKFRLLEVALIVLMLLFTGVVLLARPAAGVPVQRWRKGVLVGIGIVVAAELVLQGLALARALPIDNLSGVTVPYGRVYQQTQGFANGTTNGLGWYYPEFRLEADTRRIILTGDTFVEALQIPVEAHMGVQLETLINAANPPEKTEVLAQGLLGYGPMTFMNWRYYTHIWGPLQPDELVIVFHLANDFQIQDDAASPLTAPGAQPRIALDADGMAEVIPEDYDYWHSQADLTVLGHSAPDPLRTVVSQSMLLNVMAGDFIDRNFRLNLHPPRYPSNIERASEEALFGPATPLFEIAGSSEAEQAFELTEAILRTLVARLAEYDLTIRLVTLPHFPSRFYAENAGSDWSPVLAEYDLLLPERRLAAAAAANGVPFLGMGQTLLESGATAEEIRSLYFAEGTGYLTEAGHRRLAEAVAACFYSGESSADPAVAETACRP